MKKFLRALLYVVAALYPIFVFTFLVILKSPVKIFSLCVMIFAMTFFLTFTGSKKKDGQKKTMMDWRPLASSILLLGTGLLCFFTNQILFLKLYSVAISLILMFVFGSTLIFKPNMIFRFATLSDKSIIGSSSEKDVYRYCRNVTIIWCAFFLTNGTISTITAFSEEIFKIDSDTANTIWSVYNGGLSYLLLGLLFFVEIRVRKYVYKRLVTVFPLSTYKSYSRPHEKIMCYSMGSKKKTKKTWTDFLTETAILRKTFSDSQDERFFVPTNDAWTFIVTFTALVQTKKIPEINFSYTESFIKAENSEKKFNAQEIVDLNKKNPDLNLENIPEIDSEKTFIILADNGKLETKTLKYFEEKINLEIESNGKKIVLENRPFNITMDSPEQLLKKMLLMFTLGIEFYRQTEKQ
ncbi:MAG: hypothetical protein IKQ66_03280 [Treponema sp.]|nr:hypothetical protein [Treponema sp.]